jgi:hypothetical protein
MRIGATSETRSHPDTGGFPAAAEGVMQWIRHAPKEHLQNKIAADRQMDDMDAWWIATIRWPIRELLPARGFHMIRKYVTAFALPTVSIMAIAACQAFSPATITVNDPAAVRTANEKLLEAVERTSGVALRFTVLLGQDRIAGSYDATSRAAGFRHDSSGIDLITTADTMYLRNAPGVPEGQWAQVGAAQIAAACQFAAVADPRVALSMLRAATSVEQSDEFSYRGVLDLGKISGTAATMKNAEYFATAMPESQSTVRFTATTDRTGYLTVISAIFTTANGAFEYRADLSDFGTTAKVSIPTDAVDAPPELYS